MTRIAFCQNFSFNVSRNIGLALLMSLALSQILNAAAPRPANTQPGRESPPATAQGQNKAAAERKVEEGEALRAQGTPESLRLAVKKYEEALSIYRAGGDREGEAIMLIFIGMVHYELGEPEKALNFLNQALPLWRAVGNRRGEAVTLSKIGFVYDALGEKRNALDFLNQALPLQRAIGDRTGEAVTLHNIGMVYDSLGEKRNALDFYNQGLTLARKFGDREVEASMLAHIGGVYDFLGDKRKALDFFNQALPLARKVGDRVVEAGALSGIGFVYDALGEKRKALDFLNQALPLHRAVGDREGEARTLNGIGLAYASLGEMQKALDFLNQSLPLARTVGYRSREPETLTIIGSVYDSLGEKQKALDFYNQALPLFRAFGDSSGEAGTLYNIGGVYDSLGEEQKALDFFNQALPLLRAVGDHSGEARALTGIGLVYSSLGEKRKALDFYNQALPLEHVVGDRSGEASTLSNIGLLYTSLGEERKALEFLNQALTLARKVGDRSGEAHMLTGIGMVYDSLGEKRKALDFYNQGLPLAQKVGDRKVEVEALSGIALVKRDLGHFDESRSHIESALKIVESLRAKVVSQELRASYFATMQGLYEFYIDLLMQMRKQEPAKGHDIAALQASERARARSLIESLTEAHADIRKGIDPELLMRERASQQKLNAKAEAREKLLNGPDTEPQAVAIETELNALTIELQQIQTQIRQTSPQYAALTQPQPLTAGEIQRQLDDDTLLLEYSLGPERSFLWAVTPKTVTGFELPNRKVIEAAAQKIYDLLTSPKRSPGGETEQERGAHQVQAGKQFPIAAAELSRILLAPVAQQLGKKRLVIVADGALHYLPFCALPDPNKLDGKAGEWQPLIVEHEIVNLPSASALAELRRELKGRQPAPKTLAALADPVFSIDDERFKSQANRTTPKPDESVAGLTGQRILKQLAKAKDGLKIARLPFTRQEAEQIVALAPAGSGMKALDFEASRATATSEQLSQYRYVHFATHGLADSERSELSAIVLSLYDEQGRPQDGFLRAHEVYNLNLPAEMVTLSACETGLGKLTGGEGLVSLTRGFMYAGAARVVVSLWSVNDRATAELMTKFYRRVLVEGERPAAALREAQVEMWQDKRWGAPYYWAAFTLQGEWR